MVAVLPATVDAGDAAVLEAPPRQPERVGEHHVVIAVLAPVLEPRRAAVLRIARAGPQVLGPRLQDAQVRLPRQHARLLRERTEPRRGDGKVVVTRFFLDRVPAFGVRRRDNEGRSGGL